MCDFSQVMSIEMSHLEGTEKIRWYVLVGYSCSNQYLCCIQARIMWMYIYHVCNRNIISKKVLKPNTGGSQLTLSTRIVFTILLLNCKSWMMGRCHHRSPSYYLLRVCLFYISFGTPYIHIRAAWTSHNLPGLN